MICWSSSLHGDIILLRKADCTLASNSLKTGLTNLADVLRKSIGNDNQIGLDNMYMILSTHSLSGKDWVNLDQSNRGFNYSYVSSFAVISLKGW